MSDEFFLNYVLPLMFLVTGIALLVNAARHWMQTRSFLAGAHEVAGEVVALKKEPSSQSGADEAETYRPVVVFKTRTGRQERFESMASSNPPTYAVGDTVRVLYHPELPLPPRLHAFSDLWFPSALFAGLGLVFTAVGAGLLIWGVPS
jgi:hypothetical protein